MRAHKCMRVYISINTHEVMQSKDCKMNRYFSFIRTCSELLLSRVGNYNIKIFSTPLPSKARPLLQMTTKNEA